MNLSALIPELKLSSCLNDLEVGSIHIDSRDVKEGGIFSHLRAKILMEMITYMRLWKKGLLW